MKEYRQSSHTFSLIFWAILCTATAAVLFVHSGKVVSRALRIEEILGGVALLILGPSALVVYLVRANKVWVCVDPQRGIVVSGRRTIAWDDIRSVDRRRPVFRKSTGPAEMSRMGEDLGGCFDPACLEITGELVVGLAIVAALFVFWLVFFIFVPLVFIPLLEVFAPFGDRITITTRRGRLVLRDLRDADAFMSEIERCRPAAR